MDLYKSCDPLLIDFWTKKCPAHDRLVHQLLGILIVLQQIVPNKPELVSDLVTNCVCSPEKSSRAMSLRFGRRIVIIIEDIKKNVRASESRKNIFFRLF